MRRIALTLAAFSLAIASADAVPQSPPETTSAFEVATIKPQLDADPPRGVSSPDRFTDPNTTLRRLIEYAYEVTEAQVIGGPDWIASRRFAIDAKAAGTPSRAEMRLLVRALLAQRFNLVARIDTRELPVYILERASRNGALGPALRPTPASECAAPVATLGQAERQRQPGSAPPCGVISASPVRMTGRGVPMSQFARNVRDMGGMTGVDRIVVDRTGLDGYYSFELSYRPTETSRLDGGADNPSLFDAVREQLGLQLTPARAPVSVVVVDRATLPTAD
jgi:uncharacterized protein (TIGR03435 family)